MQRLAPLAQRLATDFGPDPRWDNPRATQIRLPGFTVDALVELGGNVSQLYAEAYQCPHVSMWSIALMWPIWPGP